MENSLYINYCGLGSPSTENWLLTQDIEIQRFYYVLGGTGWYRSPDGTKHTFQKGCVYLFPYNLRHSFHTDMSDPVSHLFYDFLSAPPIIATEPLRIPVAPDSPLHNALMLACQLKSSDYNSETYKTRLDRHMLRLLLDLVHEQMPIPFSTDPIIHNALSIIQRDYATPIMVKELARQVGFEENYFIRRFKKVMKQTPYTYLKNYRLFKARNLLLEGVSAEKAAERVGYESAASLTRAMNRANI